MGSLSFLKDKTLIATEITSQAYPHVSTIFLNGFPRPRPFSNGFPTVLPTAFPIAFSCFLQLFFPTAFLVQDLVPGRHMDHVGLDFHRRRHRRHLGAALPAHQRRPRRVHRRARAAEARRVADAPVDGVGGGRGVLCERGVVPARHLLGAARVPCVDGLGYCWPRQEAEVVTAPVLWAVGVILL